MTEEVKFDKGEVLKRIWKKGYVAYIVATVPKENKGAPQPQRIACYGDDVMQAVQMRDFIMQAIELAAKLTNQLEENKKQEQP